MKKYFLLIFLLITVSINNNGFGQDSIKTKTGDEIKAKILGLTRKRVTYKPYGDPEFNTYTIPYKELSSIQKRGEKKATLFNHHLPRAFIALSFGPSFALGNLKSTSFANKNGTPGFAQNVGPNGKLDITIYLYKRLGITLSGGGGGYGLNGSYASAYGNSLTNLNSNSNWQFFHAMVGPIYSVKLAKRITWDFKAKVGIVATKTPYINLQYYNPGNQTDPNNYSSVQYYATWASQLSYSFGTSFRIALSRRIAFYLAVDYINTKPQINGQTTINNPVNASNNWNNAGSTSGQYSNNYKFSFLNTSAGFAYQMKRKRNKYE
jgi:hypothetical protein